jgi:hypothetical protein
VSAIPRTGAPDYTPPAMNEPRRAWRYLLPSIADLLFIGLLLTRVQPTLFHDADTGWHLWAGTVTLEHGPGPIPDTLTFTQAGTPFENIEWLGEVLLVLFYRHAGYLGIAVLAGVVFAATFSWLYRILLRESEDPVAAILVTVLAAQITLFQFLARPVIFSFPLFLAAHELARNPSRRTIWLLPLLTALWANLHGSAYFAPAIGSFYWLSRPRKNALGLATLLSFLALGVTPWGYAWVYKQILANQSYFGQVEEWMSPRFSDLRFLPFFLGILIALAARWRAPRLSQREAIWGLGWLAAALLSARLGPFAILAWAPYLVRDLARGQIVDFVPRVRRVWTSLKHGLQPMELKLHPLLWPLVIGAFALFFTRSLTPIYPAGVQDGFPETRFPKAALREAARLDPGSRVFCNYAWSGYVSWEAQERWKTFIDGRAGFFGSAMLDDYLTIVTLRPGWQGRLDAWAPDWLLLSPDLPLVSVLPVTGRWRVAYQDQIAALLVPVH